MTKITNSPNFTGKLEKNNAIKKRIKNDSLFNQYGIYQTLKAVANVDDGKVYSYEEKKMVSNREHGYSYDTIAMIKDEVGNRIVSKVITSFNEMDENYEAPKSFISDMISEFALHQYGLRVGIDETTIQKDIFDLMI